MSNEGSMRAAGSVLVCHEDPVTRLGLATALTAASMAGPVRCCAPDDAQPGGWLDGASAALTDYGHALRLRSCAPSLPIMIVTARDGEHEIRCAIDAGIHGYLLAGCALDELVQGVRALCAGQRYLCAAAAGRIVESLSREALTPREMAVLRCLVAGHVNKQIGDELDIALGTVKAHTQSIFTKLDVMTRTQAVTVATQRGLVAVQPRDAEPAWPMRYRVRGHGARPNRSFPPTQETQP